MMLSVTEELHRAGKDKEVRAVVLKGEGKVFSSGHNLKEMTVETGYEYHKKIFDTCEAMMRLVGQIPVPVIGVVTGHAAAASSLPPVIWWWPVPMQNFQLLEQLLVFFVTLREFLWPGECQEQSQAICSSLAFQLVLKKLLKQDLFLALYLRKWWTQRWTPSVQPLLVNPVVLLLLGKGFTSNSWRCHWPRPTPLVAM